MKKMLLIGLAITILILVSACVKQGDDVCDAACKKQGYVSGSCESLGVMGNPCERELNKTTIYSQDGYCEEYGKDELSWWKWNVLRTRIEGIANKCCCE